MVKYHVEKLDKCSRKVVVYCDMGEIEIDRGVKMIQVMFNDEELSWLRFEYGRNELTILDIRSNILRKGYATMLINSLLDIVKIHNSTIKNSLVLTSRLKDMYIIKSIKGSIIPLEGIIQHEDLCSFYNKQGFIKDRMLLKLIK